MSFPQDVARPHYSDWHARCVGGVSLNFNTRAIRCCATSSCPLPLLLPLLIGALPAAALPVTFSSDGNFATPTHCSAAAPACKVDNGGNRLILGTNSFFGLFPIPPYSTLTAVDIGPVSTTTPKNDFTIGEIDWVNAATTNTDKSFEDDYTLTLNFSAPASASASATLNLKILQPTNPPGDKVTQLVMSALGPLNMTFAGLQVSDVKFVLGSAGSGSTFNPATGLVDNPRTTRRSCSLLPISLLFPSLHRSRFLAWACWASEWSAPGETK